MEVARKLVLDEGIDWPSADISFTWVSSAKASFVIRMHFSRVVGLPKRDLELTFTRPLAVAWEEETYSHIPTPQDLPGCASARWANWTYPILWVEGSVWADRYAASMYTEKELPHHPVREYVFVSMNDILHLLSEEPPTVSWVPSVDA